MKLNRSGWYLLPLLYLIVLACGPRREENDSVQVSATLQSEMTVLNDSLFGAWNQMMANENQRLRYAGRLTDELAFRGWPDSAQLQRIEALRDSVAGLQYGHPRAVTSARIDAYDAASARLSERLNELGRTPGFDECPLCLELLEDINRLDNEIVVYRQHYDEHAEAYNAFVRANKQVLVNQHPAYDSVSTVSLFRLPF